MQYKEKLDGQNVRIDAQDKKTKEDSLKGDGFFWGDVFSLDSELDREISESEVPIVTCAICGNYSDANNESHWLTGVVEKGRLHAPDKDSKPIYICDDCRDNNKSSLQRLQEIIVYYLRCIDNEYNNTMRKHLTESQLIKYKCPICNGSLEIVGHLQDKTRLYRCSVDGTIYYRYQLI